MTRSIFVLAIALAVVAPAAAAYADEPTPAQLDKAKKAFMEGKKAFDGGDFAEAAQKFKESYNLSKKPALLYNIALANESAAQDDIALFYYRKFLTDAPADSPQRAEVTDRVKALEKKFQTGGPTGPTTTGPTTTEPTGPTGPTTTEPAHTGPITIKPPGTYKETDFQHQMTEVAPPAKPLDVTAFVPEDSGWTVTLFFRTAGEGKFTSKPMKWRYKELVARIPPNKMIGNSVQYYIEVKDQAGAVVTRSGKSTSPNLINLEAGAPPKFYPDFSEDGTVATVQETTADDTEEDPLHPGQKKPKKVVVSQAHDGDGFEVQPQPTPGGTGFADVGSTKFKYMKWGSTGVAVASIGLSVLFYVQAGNYAKALEDEAGDCGAGQCPPFDSYSQSLESTGKQRQTLSKVMLGVGIGTGIIAGYYWYKDLKAKKRGEIKVSGKASSSPEAASWVVAPTIGDGFAGAAAAARF